MANEIRISSNITINKDNFFYKSNHSQAIDQDVAGGGNPGTVSIGFAAEEAIALGDITTEGWALFKNIDLTNFVNWGPESGGAMVIVGRLEPGEIALFRLEPGVTLRMQADTADCLVDIRVFED